MYGLGDTFSTDSGAGLDTSALRVNQSPSVSYALSLDALNNLPLLSPLAAAASAAVWNPAGGVQPSLGPLSSTPWLVLGGVVVGLLLIGGRR